MPKIDTLKEEGNRYFKNEEFAKAINCYKEGLDMEPKNPTLNCNLAQAYLALGNFAEAEVHAVVTLAQRTDSVKAFYRASKAAQGMMKRERALLYLRAGLEMCPKADELKLYIDDMNKDLKEMPVNTCDSKTKDVPEVKADHSKRIVDGDQNEKPVPNNSTDHKSKVRSRSSSSNSRGSNKASRSTAASITLSSSANKSSNNCAKNGTAVKTDKNPFIETLLKIKSELLPEEKEALMKKRDAAIQIEQKLQACMKEGSDALMSGLARQASEKYKAALDIVTENNIENVGLLEIDHVILKYSLSISWIQTLNYNNIVQSITYLTDIEINNSAKLPAVYFGLGNAFYRLNRFKTALQHLDKGIHVVDKNFKITPHPWPGTMDTIVETTKTGLKEFLNKMIQECKTYREPDAICRYTKCLSVSVHIIPSKIIFYSDPDFMGYVVIICEENCKITYHIGCWKHYKDSILAVGKLSDKDMLGHACLTSDCLYEGNRQSVIICIEVYGEDGKIKTSCLKEPTKTDNVNEHRKEKKKRNEKVEKVAKPKQCRPRVRRIIPQNTVKKGKTRSMTKEFLVCLQRLVDMRSINFGFVESMQWNPIKDYFGRNDVANIKTYLTSNHEDSESLKQRKDFIFTYFYEYLNDEGPKKFSVLEKKWSEEVSQFPGIDFITKHDGICDFLLQSYRFASIDDNLCLANQIASVYHNVQIEMEQSASFILSVSNRSIEDELAIKKCLMSDNTDNHETDMNSSPVDELNFPSTSFSQPTCKQAKSNVPSSYAVSADIQLSDVHSECDSPIPDLENFIMYESCSDENDGTESIGDSDSDDDNVPKDLVNYEINSSNAYLLDITENIKIQPSNNSNEILVNNMQTVDNSLDFQLKTIKLDDAPQNLDIENTVVLGEAKFSSNLAAVSMCDIETQTESYNDLAKELEALKNENMRLKLQTQIVNDDKRNMISDFQKKMDEYQVKIQELEIKMSKVIADKDQAFNKFQQDIGKRDVKYEVLVKKHKEEIDSLRKKKDEDSLLLKKTLDSLEELNKDDEKKINIIDRLECQLRRANEQVLNLRKSLGECKLDFYLSKCRERMESMDFITKYMLHLPYSKISEMKNAMDAWHRVARELQETRDLLQIQYDILAQQLKTKVSADCLLQLELAELPREPPYPLQDFNNIIYIVQKYLQNNNVGEQSNFVNRSDVPLRNPHVHPGLPSLIRAFPETSNANSFGLGSSFFSDNPSSMVHQYRHPNINENGSNNISRAWNTPMPEHMVMKETPNACLSNAVVNSNFSSRIPENQHFKQFQALVSETLSTGNSEIHATVKQTPDVKKLGSLVDNHKSIVPLEEKKSSYSSVSGLIPIEMSKTSLTDFMETLGHGPKPTQTKKGSPLSKVWNYERLMEELLKHFKKHTEVELSECVAILREKNGNKLSGLTIAIILRRVEKILEEKCSKTSGSMGMDKFGGAWGEIKEKSIIWSTDDLDNECIICHVGMESKHMTSLQCKHSFHTDCVRTWLNTSSTCPICRKYTCLADEFPPLA